MKRFNFNKPLVESPYPPQDTNVLWVDVDESTGKVGNIKEFKNGEWADMFSSGTHLLNYSGPALVLQTSEPVIPADLITTSPISYIHADESQTILGFDESAIATWAPEGRWLNSYWHANCFEPRYEDKIKSITMPEGVKTIGSYAFCNLPIKEFVIPDTVEQIGGSILDGCLFLEHLHIGAMVQNIEGVTYALFGYNMPYYLKTITVSPDNKQYSSGKNNDCVIDTTTNTLQLTLTGNIPDGITTVNGLCMSPHITSLTIPKSVVTWYDYTQVFITADNFTNHSSLTLEELTGVNIIDYEENGVCYKDGEIVFIRPYSMVVLPEGITKIPDGMFAYNTMTEYVIPEGVTELGSECFKCCANLTSLTIPNTIINHSMYRCFAGCLSLNKVKYLGTLDEFSNTSLPYQFEYEAYGCPLTEIECLDGVYKVYKNY